MPPISIYQWITAGAFGVLLIISIILKVQEAKRNKAKRLAKKAEKKP